MVHPAHSLSNHSALESLAFRLLFTGLRSICFGATLVLSLGVLAGCGGSGGGGDSGIEPGSKNYSLPNTTQFVEVPAIELIGGGADSSQTLYFNPKGPRSSEWYDSDEDGIEDKPINGYTNIVNAANRMYDEDEAACYGNNTGSLIWTSAYQPDTLPNTASYTGTQYIQIVFPFNLDPNSIFDGNPLNVGSDYLKGTIQVINEDNEHVNCTVLLDGKDAQFYYDPVAHPQGDDYVNDPNWPEEIQVAPNVVVLIAQSQVDQVTGSMPGTPTAFCSTVADPANWESDKKEIRIRIGTVADSYGNEVQINARYYILKNDPGFDPSDSELRPNLAPTDITAWDVLGVDDDPGITSPDNLIVGRDTSFILTFNKPVVPETVGRSIIFNPPPFNGNTKVVTNKWNNLNPPSTSTCYPLSAKPSLGTNVSVVAFFYDQNGASSTQAVIPIRVHPLHQNNLATYVIDPLISLPGSTPTTIGAYNPIKIRVQVTVYEAPLNGVSADPDDSGPASPVNLGPCSFFGETFKPGGIISRTFTVDEGGRYVNAPVSPNALYYAMGAGGIGVVDLDGNGFTTNHPNFTKVALVTSIRYYNRNGNAGMGNGNNYAYGAKANPGNPIGLGHLTAVPGVNEGSGVHNPGGDDDVNGMDKVVCDSLGNAQLYPDSTGPATYSNISDIDLGDFLDTIFYDTSNRWARKSLHVSYVMPTAGDYVSNSIDTPPQPNPPPLTLPIGMRVVDVLVDDKGVVENGAFVIMGKEVFTVGLQQVLGANFPWPMDTAFVHLKPAELCNPPTTYDQPFPPNPNPANPYLADYCNSGPLAESSTLGYGVTYGCRQQIGNFLFACDKNNNEVKVINSNSMEVITSISGFSSPDSLTVSGDLNKLYVTNQGNGLVSVFNVDPLSEEFLNHIADIPVGNQPKGLCAQPDYEDVLVCNYGDSSISIINMGTNTVRKTISSLVNNPWDMVAGPRQSTFGYGAGIYFGYISNYGGNNILVFESGPSGYGGIGYDDILDPVPDVGSSGYQWRTIENPRGICWDTHFYEPGYLNGGCFVAHSSGSYPMVSRINFTKQQANWGPIFLQSNSGAVGGTPGFGKRIFEIIAQWGGPENPLSSPSGAATDVALMDYTRELWFTSNWTGNPYVTNYGSVKNNPAFGMPVNHKHPTRILTFNNVTQYHPTAYSDRLFISYAFEPKIDVINPVDGTLVKTITGLSSPAKVLKTFFKY